MPRKLTVIGVLMALTFGALGVFHSSASATPIQTFLKADVDYDTCFGGAAPTGGVLACGAGSSDTVIPPNFVGTSYNIIRLPQGSRLTLPVTFTPYGAGGWQVNPALSCTAAGPALANNNCSDGSAAGDPTTRSGIIGGDVTANVDLLCNSPQGQPDVLAQDAAGGSSTGTGLNGKWPSTSGPVDPTWVPFNFKRTFAGTAGSQSVLAGTEAGAGIPIPVTGSPSPDKDAYVDTIKPQPSSYKFVSLDGGLLTHLWLFGTATFTLPNPTPLQNVSYESGYASQAGLVSSVALLGGDPSNPPSNDYVCLDSPQSSVSSSIGLKGPASPGMYPRWTIFQSAADFRDGTVNRILDMQCITVSGGPALTDADNDCLPSTVDTNDNNPDVDGDGVPDGVEAFSGTRYTLPCGTVGPLPVLPAVPPGVVAPPAQGTNPADCDGDGANDYEEMFNFTDPSNPDTDGDGYLDHQYSGKDEDNASPSTILHSKYADNCPSDANASQANTDSQNDYRLKPTVGFLDTTNPHQDLLGDACDPDADNDGIPNVAEPLMLILNVGAPTFCKGPGTAGTHAPAVTMDPLNRDSDSDLGLDGRECQGGSRPDLAVKTAGQFGRLPFGNTSSDPDLDQLFNSPSGGLSPAESFYHTQGINVAAPFAVNDVNDGVVDGQDNNPDGDGACGGAPGTCAVLTTNNRNGIQDADSDNDGLKDGVEVRYYGTDPGNYDTDKDGCGDGTEAADVNGDRAANVIDLLNAVSVQSGGGGVITDPITGVVDQTKLTYDFNRDGVLNVLDLSQMSSPLVFLAPCGIQQGQLPLVGANGTKLSLEP